MIKILLLIFVTCLSFHFTACAQNLGTARSNQPVTTQASTGQTKAIEVPSGIKNAQFEAEPEEDILLLTLSGDSRILYQDNPLDDSSLKILLTDYNEKHKNDPSTTGSKLPPDMVEDAKFFYIKADAGLQFSQVLKVLKAVQASSATSYRAKFIVKPAEEAGAMAPPPNSIFVVNMDLGIPEKANSIPRPNPLKLTLNMDKTGKFILNSEPMDKSRLVDTLTRIFKEREQTGAYEEGTNEVDKRLTLSPAPDVKYGDVIKLIDDLNETYARIEFGELRTRKVLEVE